MKKVMEVFKKNKFINKINKLIKKVFVSNI